MRILVFMGTIATFQRIMVLILGLLLSSCSAAGYAPPGPSGSADLSRYVLVIQETPDGQVSHSWQSLSGFDLSKYPHLVSSSRLDRPIVRAAFNRDCESEFDECIKMCKASRKGRNWSHASAGSKDDMCRERCMPAYLDCCKLKELAEAGKLRISFSAVDSAVDWLKQHHRELLVGTVVVIAGVAFVVATGGGGIMVLAPALLLASSGEPSSAHAFTWVEP